MAIGYKSGDVTVTVDPALHGKLMAMVDRMIPALRPLRDGMRQIAVEARQDWYQHVDEKTGKTGQIVYEEEIRGDTLHMRVTSLDTRKSKTGRPIPSFVHEPGALAVIWRRAKPGENAAKFTLHKFVGEGKERRAYIGEPNPKASGSANGRYLFSFLIRSPVQRLVKNIGPSVAKEMARKSRK